MDLRHLQRFVAIAEELNFTRTAARLHIAQPSLSVQIQRLEAEVGAQLLARNGRTIRLTEAGQVFLVQARKTLAEAQRGITLAQQAAHGGIGHLSIGYNTAAEFQAFPKIVPAFKERWPNVQLSFRSLKISQQLDELRSDTLDVGFVWLPIPAQEFDVLELTKVALLAVLPAKHRLAASKVVTIEDLSGEALILPTRLVDSETHHQIEQLFAQAGARLNVMYELETLLSVVNFVAMGSACSILAEYASRVHWEGVVYKPLRPTIVKTLAVVRARGREGLAESFCRFAAEALRSTAPVRRRRSQ